jgi:hypothetical protein
MIMQESRYIKNATRCVHGIDLETKERQQVCTDFGLTMINLTNVIYYKWCTDKLLTDIEYAVEKGALILKNFKMMYKKQEPDMWWTRYNASSMSKRETYKRLVMRFY